jgi:MRG-binding protein
METDRFAPLNSPAAAMADRAGIHKHFRMLAISNALSSHGFTSSSTPHTRIPGIWAKLRVLYDLDALDERENSHAGIRASPSPPLSPISLAKSDDDFELPDDEYGDLMWQRRFPSRGGMSVESSPELIEGLQTTKSEAGVDLSAIRGQGEDSQEVTSVKGKSKKTAAGKTAKGKAARSTRSTPADEAEEEEDEEEEEEEEGSQAKKSSAKGKPARRNRRR